MPRSSRSCESAESERAASEKRADKAADWLFEQIVLRLQASGLTPPASMADLQRTAIFTVVAGAADLKVKVPLSEADRLSNRRVEFLASHFKP